MVQKFSYNWLCDYLGEIKPTVEVIADALTKHAFEVEGIEGKGENAVIELKILPDRGSDCLCHRGIARELCTILNTEIKNDPLVALVSLIPTEEITVTIEDAKACPRFTASIIRGVKVGPSPEWLQNRLKAIGVRSINNIVDATNYVMFDLGQPIHAYDAVKFPQTAGVWNFVVRKANDGEQVSLLAEGGRTEDRIVTLKGGELLIVDGTSNTAVGLAGVKGGRFAGVDEHTTDIIIEAAHFEPGLTRRTARGLGIVIDASKRFENEPSRALPPLAQQNIVDLIIKIAGGEAGGILDVYPNEKSPQPVVVNPAHVTSLLGVDISTPEIISILTRGDISVEVQNDVLLCTGPLARTDLNIEADFIEEVGRVYGYHHMVSVVPEPVPLPEWNTRHVYCEQFRDALVSLGFTEIITTTFRNNDEIGLQSSMASDKCFLRSELHSSLADALTKNAPFIDLLGTSDTKLFEIGTVFTRENKVVAEHYSLALGVRFKTTGYTGKEDVILTKVITDLESSLDMKLSFASKEGVAELNLSELINTLPTKSTYKIVPQAIDGTYAPFSIYPSITRDIALWVPEGTSVDTVAHIIREGAGPLCVRVTHMDTFTKEGRTSVAFRLVFQSKQKTLAASDVDTPMEVVYFACSKVGFAVR